MAMDGKELVEKLAKLSQVQSIKDIPQLCSRGHTVL